ncbi:hypothetical protein KIPB_009984 [Kipferlia bialata]|uniref:Uncharacterized protein n=1 Tax=Kipferlia bialata TaxID=797122 RepID=A0A9K3GM03_9EUKA|nr:hypothetical protein KIPB_009984 [Kipferlia bialata]|eukprot:g9984.t1
MAANRHREEANSLTGLRKVMHGVPNAHTRLWKEKSLGVFKTMAKIFIVDLETARRTTRTLSRSIRLKDNDAVCAALAETEIALRDEMRILKTEMADREAKQAEVGTTKGAVVLQGIKTVGLVCAIGAVSVAVVSRILNR